MPKRHLDQRLHLHDQGGGGTIAFVQVNAATPQTASASVPVTYPVAQTAGNLNIVAVGWNDTTSTVSSVSDSRGNIYTQAGTMTTGTALRQAIYYAKNIAAGSNTVTVMFNQAAAYVDVRILEYSGLDHDESAGCDGGSGGEQRQCEQRSGDDDFRQRADLWRGNDRNPLQCGRYGIHFPDHHLTGRGHCGRQGGQQRGQQQRLRPPELFFQLGHADGDF